MVSKRPFKDHQDLKKAARETWWKLGAEDWLVAFRSHPKIGEQKAAQHVSTQSSSWSGQEQSGMRSASPTTIDLLGRLNREYEAKFGYIFIVCATGKSSDELLEILRERLENDPDQELRVAAAEQMKITEIRLDKLVSTESV